ncbi:MAG: hypothetical protein JWQ94_1825 [Tardiphaga sp.]|nr:hypothetical protein [Tardiphaga sp.]
MTKLDQVRRWASGIVRDVAALWLAARDPRVPWVAKAVAAVVAAYALSPIDLIPDFIPVIGYLDDLLLVPLGILLAVRLVPPALMAEFRAAARDRGKPVSRAGAVIIVVIWMVGAAMAGWMVWRLPSE